MANLNYNHSIFTNVHKWDNEYSYLGIIVSGKLNQYNGQGYPILDAIDIDWDGAYVNTLNSYINTTEDLIKLINRLGQTDINIQNRYVSIESFDNAFNEYRNIISNEFNEMTYIMQESILQNLLSRYEILSAISDVLIDKTRYMVVPYDHIVNNLELTNYGQEHNFFLFNESNGTFNEIKDKFFIIQHPELEYYIFIMDDIIKLNDNVENINNIIGKEIYDIDNNSYTYTGFYQRFNNVETDLSYLSYYLDNNTETTIEAYNYAYSSYVLSNINKEKIGSHTRYNVYEKVENTNSIKFRNYLLSHNNNIFIKDPNDSSNYISIQYTGNPDYEYYCLYDIVNGTGIEKEIEDLESKITDNSYILYHLHTQSNNTYIKLNITPENTLNKPIDRTIILDLVNSYINSNTGEITNGIANQDTLINGVSYICGWKILNKED